MPKIENDHTDYFYYRVDWVKTKILEDESLLKNPQKQRTPELVKIVKKEFGITTRTAQRLIAEAKKEVRKLGKKNLDKAYAKAIRDREFIIAKAKEDGSLQALKLAQATMADRDKLQGLYIEQVEHSGSIELKHADLKKLPESYLQRIVSGEDPAIVIAEYNAIKNSNSSGSGASPSREAESADEGLCKSDRVLPE